jgi:hypothetical protein
VKIKVTTTASDVASPFVAATGWPVNSIRPASATCSVRTALPGLKTPAQAPGLARAQLQSSWPRLLEPLIEQCHRHAKELCQPLALSSSWRVSESEYATDVMFKSPAALAGLSPGLVHQAIKHFGSTEVLRFLGHQVEANAGVHGNHQGEILSSLKHRCEGLRRKQQAAGNAVKLYDKQGSVLRVETTLRHPHQLRVYRASEGDPKQRKRWQVLRKSVGDLHRRAAICEAINGRYLEALASVHPGQSAGAVARAVCRPILRDGRGHRALNPWSAEDGALLELISPRRVDPYWVSQSRCAYGAVSAPG